MGRTAYLLPLLLAIAAHSSAADPGYLPAVGPAPLRFAPPRPPAQPASAQLAQFLIPAPAASPASPGLPAMATNQLANTAPSTRNEAPGPATDAASSPTPTNATSRTATTVDSGPPPEPPSIPAHSVIQGIMPQPQLFLQYFTPDYLPGTNSAGVLLPVGFIPPQPRTGNGNSSATYQTTPPQNK